jgi:hypothetical protein
MFRLAKRSTAAASALQELSKPVTVTVGNEEGFRDVKKTPRRAGLAFGSGPQYPLLVVEYQKPPPGASPTTFWPTASLQQSQGCGLALPWVRHVILWDGLGFPPLLSHKLKFCLPTACWHCTGGPPKLPQSHQYTPLVHVLLPWLSVPFTQMLHLPYVPNLLSTCNTSSAITKSGLRVYHAATSNGMPRNWRLQLESVPKTAITDQWRWLDLAKKLLSEAKSSGLKQVQRWGIFHLRGNFRVRAVVGVRRVRVKALQRL